MCKICRIIEGSYPVDKIYWDGKGFKILEVDGEIMGIHCAHEKSVSRVLKSSYKDGCKGILGSNVKFRWKLKKDKEHFHFYVKTPKE